MDEEELIAAAHEGDLHSFNQLVEIYQGMVYNLAYRILGDGEEAADATQEAFLSAFQAIGNFRGGSFKAWLMHIVTNACYDQLRHRKRRPATSLEALLVDSERSSTFSSDMKSPEEYVAQRELNEFLQEGINALQPHQRVTLILSDVQGLSYEEIAQVTQVSLGTVKSRLARGRARLRDHLLKREELLPDEFRLKYSDSADG